MKLTFKVEGWFAILYILISVTFVVLKLAGVIATWLVALSPLWIGAGVFVVLAIILLILVAVQG